MEFHKKGGEGNVENDISMSRSNGLQTISITSIDKKNGNYTFQYLDKVTQTQYFHQIEVNNYKLNTIVK
jgi:hypothetical protein